jgi:hypothetical protein
MHDAAKPGEVVWLDMGSSAQAGRQRSRRLRVDLEGFYRRFFRPMQT